MLLCVVLVEKLVRHAKGGILTQLKLRQSIVQLYACGWKLYYIKKWVKGKSIVRNYLERLLFVPLYGE